MCSDADSSNRKRRKHEIDTTDEYTILDVLNGDCWRLIFSYVSTTDLVRSERVSKQWRNVVIDYFHRSSKRSFDTSRYPRLTLRALRELMTLRGAAFTKLSINDVILEKHDFCGAYNHTVSFNTDDCPNLEELKIDANEARGYLKSFLTCKNLKSIYLRSDFRNIANTLIHQHFRDDYNKLERLTVNADNTSGQFLTNIITTFQNLKYLAFYKCHYLNIDCFKSIEQLPNLKTLKIDKCHLPSWYDTMKIVCSLTQLQELSLRENRMFDHSNWRIWECFDPPADLSLLKHLNLSENFLLTDDVLEQIAQTCKCLESLDVSHCCVGDTGVAAVCTSCEDLQVLDVSYLRDLSDYGIRLRSISRAKRLVRLKARGLGSSALTSSFAACLRACHALTELDVAGCYIRSELVVAAVAALNQHPRPLVLRLENTGIAVTDKLPKHSLLTVITNVPYPDIYFLR